VWHALLAAAFLAGIAFYSAFCNLPRHAPEWTAERIDLAIDRGLEHLFNSSAFTKRYDFGGEHRIHHFLLKLVLAKEPHLRLRAQMEQCDQISQDIPKWRAFAGLPGWPVEKLDDTRRTEIQRLIREDPHPYERWMLWADHASWAKLEPDDHRTLFTDTSRQKGSYDLTHALLAYWIMLRTAPETSGHLNVNARIHEVVARTLRYSHWAPRCGDSYLERIAFLMMAEPPPRISRRWIERILTVQNEDGGWIWVPSYTRTLEEMLGLKITSLPSEPHPTFLALVALAYYRDQMRAEKTAPLPAPARTQGR
jgi:hypothetical protein